MAKLHIKKDDTVVVLSGVDKGKKGTVIAVSPEEGKVIVSGVHVVSKHTKARRQGETSSIVDAESAMYASKVQLFCTKCDKPTRASYKIEGDKKVRVCKKCGKEI